MPTITIKKKKLVEEELEVNQDKYIGHRIAQIRKQKKIKQYELAKLVGYKEITAYCQIENGHNPLTLKRLKMICEILGCKSSDILPF